MRRKSFLFLSILSCIMLSVVIYLSAEAWNSSINKMPVIVENNFQQLVHGVGLGATTKPTWCYINFDQRIDPRCSCLEWPIPGGYSYCPDHTGTVSYISSKVETGVSIEIVRN